VTSAQRVRNQNADVNYDSSENDQCSDSVHLGHTLGVDIVAQDVVRRFLYELMRSRFESKTALAVGMGTSRPQLQAAIRQGYITVKHMNSIAEATGATIWGVMNEMASIAKGMEKGSIHKLSAAEMTELLEGRERKSKGRAVLQGELDEAQFSEELDEAPDDILGDEPDEPAVRPSPRRQSVGRHQRHQR
jgi:hypothetical protein